MNRSSSSGIHNSTSSFASISSSVSNGQEEHAISISPVNSLVPEGPVNSLTPSAMSSAPSNGCEATLQEPSSYMYPPSPTISLGRASNNSYATDPSSIPDTLLNDRHSLNTPVRSIASGERLVLTTVDNGSEPLGMIDMSPSSSPRHRCSKSHLSPQLPRSRHNSSSPTALKQSDSVEEMIACE